MSQYHIRISIILFVLLMGASGYALPQEEEGVDETAAAVQPEADQAMVGQGDTDDESAPLMPVEEAGETDETAPALTDEPDASAEEQLVPDADEPVRERRRGVRRLGDVVTEGEGDWSLDIPEVPATPAVPIPVVNVPDAELQARLQNLLARRSFEAESPEYQMEVALLLEELESEADAALEVGEAARAESFIDAIEALDETRPGLVGLRQRLALYGEVEALMASAALAVEEERYYAPPGENALEFFQAVLEADPGHEAALEGLAGIQARLLEGALEVAEELDFEGAEALIESAAEIDADEAAVGAAREAVASIRAERVTELDRRVVEDIDQSRFDEADEGLTQLIAMGGNRERIERLRQSLEDARLYGGFEPGQTFSDELPGLDQNGPEMVVIPAGNFMMGSPDNEAERNANEGPRFRVTFQRGFALGRTEVTVGQFRVFVEDTGYVTESERLGWSRTYDADTGRIDRRNNITWRNDYMGGRASDDLPVVHVSWNDAAAYAAWLADKTDRNYRLPSEAEYEYALRAGSQSTYWWGEGTPEEVVENLTGDGEMSTTRRRWTVSFRRYDDGHWGPAPVASFPPNPFGLHDMGGNVMSWTEDCWHDSYVRAPINGTAWVNPGCERRVLRGGSWSATPAMARSAFRLASGADGRDARVGFRVARDL